MKIIKFILITTFVLISILVKSQIESINYRTYKIYNDSSMIAYTNINKFKDAEEVTFVEKEIFNNNIFIRFTVSSNNFNEVMIETAKYISEQEFKEILNNIIAEYKPIQKE